MKKGHSRRKQNKFRWKLLGSSVIVCILIVAAAVYFCNSVFATKDGETSEPAQVSREGTEAGRVQEANSQELGIQKAKKMETESSTASAAVRETEIVETASESDSNAAKAAEILGQMTLEQKVAQLFIILPESLTGVSNVTQAGSATRAALEKYQVGGLIYMRNNIKNPQQLKAMTSKIQEFSMEISGLPLFLGVDEEGGDVSRIASNPEFPVTKFDKMWNIGKSGDIAKAYEVGDTIGAYLAEYGLNFDFMPDGDVLSNPDNKVIGTRSFSSDPAVVSAMAEQVTKGLNRHKIQNSIKHFPGHGATAGDTHEGFSYIDKTLEELKNCELIPFVDAIRQGADCIMVGHISVPKVIGDHTPSSLSSVMMTDVLRGQLGFDGVVITDALNMGAIQNFYPSGEAAVKSFQAGADILLMPADFNSAYQAVLAAVKDKSISEERLNESVLRILKLKCKLM